MGTLLYYVDESYDSNSGNCFVLSAMGIPAARWKDSFDAMLAQRRDFAQRYNMRVSKEIHSTDFFAGRGQYSTQGVIPKALRVDIGRQIFRLLATLSDAEIINVCLPRANMPSMFSCVEEWALNRLATRIHRSSAARQGEAIMIFDDGKETYISKWTRKIRRYNPQRSKYGTWDNGQGTVNYPTDRIIEDAIFKSSSASFFIQAADMIAYSLLRREEPLPRLEQHRFSELFTVLRPIINTRAHYQDPFGIVRR